MPVCASARRSSGTAGHASLRFGAALIGLLGHLGVAGFGCLTHGFVLLDHFRMTGFGFRLSGGSVSRHRRFGGVSGGGGLCFGFRGGCRSGVRGRCSHAGESLPWRICWQLQSVGDGTLTQEAVLLVTIGFTFRR